MINALNVLMLKENFRCKQQQNLGKYALNKAIRLYISSKLEQIIPVVSLWQAGRVGKRSQANKQTQFFLQGLLSAWEQPDYHRVSLLSNVSCIWCYTYSQAGVQARCSMELIRVRPSWLCTQHRLSKAPLATYKMDILGLDPAQLPMAKLDTTLRRTLKIEELHDHLV